MGRGLDRKEVVRNLRILPSTEQANKINISENKWQNGWMDEWIWRGCFRSPHYFDLLCLAKYFSLLYSIIFMSSLNCFFFLSISLKHRIFSYIFFQWYVGKAPVNISIEVDNVHFWFCKKDPVFELKPVTLALSIDLDFHLPNLEAVVMSPMVK